MEVSDVNAIRRAYLMAHLINLGSIHRRDLVQAFGISEPQATNDLRDFQAEFGKLLHDPGPRTYSMPTGYPTTVDMTHVLRPLRMIAKVFDAQQPTAATNADEPVDEDLPFCRSGSLHGNNWRY